MSVFDIQSLIEYGEGWYKIFEELERIRSIENNEPLIEDASNQERWHRKGADELITSEV